MSEFDRLSGEAEEGVLAMENGLYIGRKADNGVKAVFIDEENLELARISRETKARREAAESRAAAAQVSKAARRERNRRQARIRMILNTVAQTGAASIVGAAALLGVPGVWIAAIVGAMALALVCFRLGRLVGNNMRKHYISGSAMIKTSLSTGRIAGDGVISDDYGDESGNPRMIRDRGRVHFPSDGTNPQDMNGPVIVVRKGKEKEGACQ